MNHARRPGARGMPVILVGEQHLDGINPAGFAHIHRRQAVPPVVLSSCFHSPLSGSGGSGGFCIQYGQGDK
jgi:hypothetical protein